MLHNCFVQKALRSKLTANSIQYISELNWSFAMRLLSVLKVLLYDLRSSRPLLVKDHYYNLPIKSINFSEQQDLVLSADAKIIKMWNKDTVRLSNA